MFERFTERARQVVVLAQEEVRLLAHDHIGTEHLLLGLLREEEGIAARVLHELGVGVEEVRAEIERRFGRGEQAATGQIPFTPSAKEALELALREALRLGHNYIGTEHVLLGLLRADQGPATEILGELGVLPEIVRAQVLSLIGGEQRTPIASASLTARRHRRRGWQYHVVTLEGPITEQLLSPLGKDGWELVAVVGDRAVFKRPA
jgi:ATP-dependent Clp protease ATP-binding subunit ClpC